MFLLNPFGTFRGYGAYVGINPYRVLESDSPDELLGQTILELLSFSGPTGRLFSDAKTFLNESRDDETQRVRALFGLDASGLTTAKLNRRFLMTSVEQKSNQKSWFVQAYLYNSKLRTMSVADTTTLRIKHSAGAHALGVAVRRLMALPNHKQ